jgi:hypothetical protein
VVAVAAVFIAALVPLSAYIRRPKITLAEDVRGDYSEVVNGVEPRVRLLVKNAKRRRAAYQTRVEVTGYREQGDARWTWIGNRPLNWVGSATDVAVAVYAGMTRPVELGGLLRELPDGWKPKEGGRPATSPPARFEEVKVWRFHLSLYGTLAAIRLAPGAWVLQVVVGAEEGDAATYEIDVAWDGKANGPDLAFQSLQLAVRKT